jgi:hypothetical protein
VQWSTEREVHLRGFASLVGSVLQLAAYTCGDSDPTGTFSIRSSGASDENCNAANRDVHGLLPPDAAALALQKGSAGTVAVSPVLLRLPLSLKTMLALQTGRVVSTTSRTSAAFCSCRGKNSLLSNV